MMYVLLYALCRGRGLYDVTVTCRTGIMIMMMLVVYCFFWLCYMCEFSFVGLRYDDWYSVPLMGGLLHLVQRGGDWAVW